MYLSPAKSLGGAVKTIFCLLALQTLLLPADIPTNPSAPLCILEGNVRLVDGKPAPGCRVAFNPIGVELEDYLETIQIVRADVKGHFRIALKPGPYAITASRKGAGATFLSEVELKGDATIKAVDLKLDLPVQPVSGSIRTTNGRTLKGAKILFSRITRKEGNTFWAEIQEGNFSLALPKGEYLVSAKAPGALNYWERFTVKPGPNRFDLSLQPTPKPAGAEVKEWIKGNLIPLKSCEAGKGFEDLQPLKTIIGNARVVSLGEATHGTREFFKMKHRMLEFLVEEMGFNVFAIEANLPESCLVNDYVLEGKGDPGKALAGLHYWTWNTEEVLDMIRWMRGYNEDTRHTRKVRFYGIDMQYPEMAVVRVAKYLEGADPDAAQFVREKLVPLATDKSRPYPIPERDIRPWLVTANEVLARLDAHRQAYVSKTSTEDFEISRQDARILTQWAEMCCGASFTNEVRDRAMSENMQWVLQHEGPDTKAVLWAHNAHAQFSESWMGDEFLGHRLRKILGKDLVAFGFSFNEGGFQAKNSGSNEYPLQEFQVKPHPNATLDQAFASSGVPIFALNLKAVPKSGRVGQWFQSPQVTRTIGALYNEAKPDAYLFPWPITESFDAMFFVERTTRAVPNPKLDTPVGSK